MKHIYDNVHKQYTQWEEPLIAIINTPEFQRLKRIKQLGVCHHVFPGATHTRFEHSLGVGYLARKSLESLQRRQPELKIDEYTILTFQLAGLCHDLGHGPLSHAFDHFLSTLTTNTSFSQHEERSVSMLQHIVHKYTISIEPSVIQNACELIHPQSKHLPSWWYQIIANDDTGIDVDKFDYLLRDTLMTGMVCNDIDVNRFIDYARVVAKPTANKNVLCYPEKLQFDINQLFMTRHRLHAQVYQHPIVRSYEMMYTDILHTLRDTFLQIIRGKQNIEWLTEWTDDMFTDGYLYSFAHKQMFTLSEFEHATHVLHRIRSRNHYALVKEMQCKSNSQRQTFLRTVQTANTRIDPVTIGYRTNPLFSVSFYDKKDPTKCVKSASTSAIFHYHSRDFIVRVYEI